MGDRFAAMRA